MPTLPVTIPEELLESWRQRAALQAELREAHERYEALRQRHITLSMQTEELWAGFVKQMGNHLDELVRPPESTTP